MQGQANPELTAPCADRPTDHGGVLARQYVPEFDGLRALAAILVVLFHSDPGGLISGGFVGVDVFFVLSAYLITSILAAEYDRTGRIKLLQFYARRTLRLAPALILMLGAYLLVAPLLWPGYPHGRDALIAGSYTANFAFAANQLPRYLSHCWSLASEEQFYLLWPILLGSLLDARQRLPILVGAWGGLTMLRLFWPGDWFGYYYGFLPHGTGLILGAILFFAVRDHHLRLRPVHALFGALLICSLLTTGFIARSAATILFAELGAALIIGAIACGNVKGMGLLASPPLVALGKLSYGIYLWHYPIAYALRDHFGLGLTFVLTFALSLLLAAISFRTVEAWGRQIKNGRRTGHVISPSIA